MSRAFRPGCQTPWHTPSEADSYHARQLLGYLHVGKVVSWVGNSQTKSFDTGENLVG